jgi:hypothetical protein
VDAKVGTPESEPGLIHYSMIINTILYESLSSLVSLET